MAEGAERDLALRAAAGDAEAFAGLVAAFAPRLHRWLVATGTRHHDAEDVVQEAFLRAHAAIHRYDPRFAVSTWLFTIAHRLRLDQAAQRRAAQPLPEGRAAPEADPDPLPAGGIWAAARAELDDEAFRILWLRYAEDLPPAAIAGILGIGPIAARVRLHRARHRLAAALRRRPALLPAEAMP